MGCRVPVDVLDVGAGAVFKQPGHELQVAVLCHVMESRVAFLPLVPSTVYVSVGVAEPRNFYLPEAIGDCAVEQLVALSRE